MRTLDELKNNILILHYACTDVNKPPVIVTSISIRNYSKGQTTTFSFDEYANEKQLLTAFGEYMRKYSSHTILTWNQKSSTYGIQQVQRRWKDNRIKGKFPVVLDNVVDLDDVLAAEYGRKYATHPKLFNLANMNDITLKNFEPGTNEIELFESKEYRRLENSTNRKVAIIADLLKLSFDNQLKTNRPEAVFIVHGHDIKSRDALDTYLRSLELKTIILDAKPNNSMTLIEKFERYASEATVAICMLTPDDIVKETRKQRKMSADEEKRRARQNVILEMGYFFGRVGRKRVILLYRKPVEVPTDIYGITYIPFNRIRSVEGKIARELKNLGMLQ